jgi:hypothetical protein
VKVEKRVRRDAELDLLSRFGGLVEPGVVLLHLARKLA